MSPYEIVTQLAVYIRDAVRPHLGTLQSRGLAGIAASGDTTFAIDEVAEDAIVSFIERNRLSVAYYSEDKGLIEFGDEPAGVLIIDPIDGTRPAMAGFEQCVVSVAWADYKPDAAMRDVRYGCIAELKQDDILVAERGGGATWRRADGSTCPARLLPIKTIDRAPLSFEFAARPASLISTVLGDIVDAASLNGGVFVVNSTAYSLTRLVTGQLAASIDVGPRIYADLPRCRPAFDKLGGGRMIGLFSYDIAAAALIAREAGAIVTDAYGRPHDDMRLLDTSPGNVTSMCAASTPALHAALLAEIEAGMARLGGG
ncbi:MAG TPA: inositol monophosphatase family protein [Capsulimonadaceae bacterium]|jgi:myo-inositol-1(or 4)-monophosphatase